jgi:hypothetical protein
VILINRAEPRMGPPERAASAKSNVLLAVITVVVATLVMGGIAWLHAGLATRPFPA